MIFQDLESQTKHASTSGLIHNEDFSYSSPILSSFKQTPIERIRNNTPWIDEGKPICLPWPKNKQIDTVEFSKLELCSNELKYCFIILNRLHYGRCAIVECMLMNYVLKSHILYLSTNCPLPLTVEERIEDQV